MYSNKLKSSFDSTSNTIWKIWTTERTKPAKVSSQRGNKGFQYRTCVNVLNFYFFRSSFLPCTLYIGLLTQFMPVLSVSIKLLHGSGCFWKVAVIYEQTRQLCIYSVFRLFASSFRSTNYIKARVLHPIYIVVAAVRRPGGSLEMWRSLMTCMPWTKNYIERLLLNIEVTECTVQWKESSCRIFSSFELLKNSPYAIWNASWQKFFLHACCWNCSSYLSKGDYAKRTRNCLFRIARPL